MQQFTLEKSRLFPYMAWSLVIGFSIFVGGLVLELQTTVTELEHMTLGISSPETPSPR